MSVALASSSSVVNSSVLSSLDSTGTSSIAADLNAYKSAKSSGDGATADAAVVQLKADLATERASLMSTLFGSSVSSTSSSSSDLLSSVFSTRNSSEAAVLARAEAAAGANSSTAATTPGSAAASQISVYA